MTNEAYHGDTTRISKSGLDLIAKSPAHYWSRYLDPNREKKEPTAAMLLGTAVHFAILEPEEFGRRYQVLPEINKRSNAGKAEFEALMEHAKALSIRRSSHEMIMTIASVCATPFASTLQRDSFSKKERLKRRSFGTTRTRELHAR